VAKHDHVSAARLRATLPSLWIYNSEILGGPGSARSTLVWRMDVKGGPGLELNKLVLVDATNGAVVLTIDQLETALNRSVCDADDTPTQVPCTAPVATETDPPNAGDSDLDVHSAFDFAGDTYAFYASNFGRDSLDDEGLELKSTVDYCQVGQACPLRNAFWNGSQMAYGNTFASADDVVGHELTHGVTQFTSGLFYYYQSGAINESLSDVFGEFVDLTNHHGDDSDGVRWEIGEDLPASVGVIRDMADPARFDNPDSMTSPFYTPDVDQNGDGREDDAGGVHTNSGVNNRAAVLITDGGVSMAPRSPASASPRRRSSTTGSRPRT
jgi:bacillolysin